MTHHFLGVRPVGFADVHRKSYNSSPNIAGFRGGAVLIAKWAAFCDTMKLAGELDDRWLALSDASRRNPFGVAAQGKREESPDTVGQRAW
jgi:hypothetical protein